MKLKEMIKRFWTLDVHNHEGFTLVELIIVIAILAILASVGVVGYSSYVKKANMQADRTLVAEMRNVIELAMYANSDHVFEAQVTIKLSNGAAVVESDDPEDEKFVTDVLAAAYGENWPTLCALKYSGWETDASDVMVAYGSSSFSGNEDSLLEKVGNLTGAMSGFFSQGKNVPGAITSVLEAQGVDTDDPNALANGAVVALSADLSAMNAEQRNRVVDALSKGTNVNQMSADVQEVYSEVYADLPASERVNMVTLATASTIYAYAEAYCQYATSQGYAEPANILNGVKYTDETTGKYYNSSTILNNIVTAFGKIQETARAGGKGTEVAVGYRNDGAGAKDANALFAIMDALADSSDVLNENLTNSTFYKDGTAADLITAYIEIGTLVGDGEGAIVVLPSKNVLAYLGGLIK